jgi:hypothetical protein
MRLSSGFQADLDTALIQKVHLDRSPPGLIVSGFSYSNKCESLQIRTLNRNSLKRRYLRQDIQYRTVRYGTIIHTEHK